MKTAVVTALLLFCCLPENTAQTSALRLELVELPATSPMATIECIFEDSRGFVWFGAYSGLYRFDGYDLVHYRHNPNDPYSLGDNKIRKIVEDKHGNFWIGTQSGIHYFDLAKQQFTNFNDTSSGGIGKVYVRDMALDGEGVFWLVGGGALYRHNSSKNQFDRVKTVDDNAPVSFIKPTKNGLFFTQNNRLYLRTQSDSVEEVVLSENPALITGFTTDHPSGAGGFLWVCTMQGLYRVNLENNKVETVPELRGVRVHSVLNKGAERWVFTAQGLFFLKGTNLNAEGPAKVVVNGKPYQPDYMIACQSPNGITWLSDTQRNLFKHDPGKNRFQHVPFDLMGPMKVVEYTELYEFAPDELLLTGEKGPMLYNIRTGEENPFAFKPTENRENWETGGLLCFLEEKNGLLWIGTSKGLFLFDKKNKRFIPLKTLPGEFGSLPPMYVRDLMRDSKGRLWIATWNAGLYCLDRQGVANRYFEYSQSTIQSFTYAGRSLYETRDGAVWYGSRGGLAQFLEIPDSFRVYRNIANDPTSISDNTVFCIFEDDAGFLWTGSYGGGLNRLDRKTGTFQHYTTDDGLINNNVFCLLPDDHGKIWMTGFNGLSVLDLKTETFQKFVHHQGLLNQGYDAFLYGKSPYSGRLMLGGTKGIDVFHPDSVLQKRNLPKVHFTGFKLFNETVPVGEAVSAEDQRFYLEKDLLFTSTIALRYNQNVLTFDYAALEYASPQTVQYAYWLVGFDTAWQYVGDKRSVTFTNLNPGKYTLKVKSTNGDGVWTPGEDNETSLRLVITPPWWQTWTFRGLVLLGMAGLVTGVYNYRVRQIRERAELNQRIAQVKMEALRSQMNPHFVFNCLSSLKLFVEKNETEKASDHISKFAALLRRVLDDARTDTDTVTLERELDTLRRYVELEMIRFKDKFSFRMDIDPEVELQNIEVPPLILQPYVENAILHGLQNRKGSGGHLLVSVKETAGNVLVVVEDNGVGREAAMLIKNRTALPQQSHGLNVTAERLSYFSQKTGIQADVETSDLINGDGHPVGTRVTLKFQIP